MQGEEPSSGLIYALIDEVGGEESRRQRRALIVRLDELLPVSLHVVAAILGQCGLAILSLYLVFKGIVLLGIGHRA